MENRKNSGWKIYGRWGVLLIFLVILGFLLWKQDGKEKYGKLEMTAKESKQEDRQWKKGYDIPVEEGKKREAGKECLAKMDQIKDIYQKAADKEESDDLLLSDQEIQKIKEILGESGEAVTGADAYSDMENYEKVESFLQNSEKGKEGSVVLYYVKSGGGLNRREFQFRENRMYIFETIAEWNSRSQPVITSTSYTRMKSWRYTKKGWFAYELCAPKPPEVSEVVDAGNMIRVRPMDEQCREFSRLCLSTLGYRGNNLLCSNWDVSHLSGLDFNGLFDAFYEMKYDMVIDADRYKDGIPEAEFERMMMEYLPVTQEELRSFAEYDESAHIYLWVRLGTGNYTPTTFGTSVPEVVEVKKQENGTVILTVEAVCMAACNDDVLTHQLTVKFNEDGTFWYLGNYISEDELAKIPEYQARIQKDDSE